MNGKADAPVARANPLLLGQASAEQTLLTAWRSGRLPHGWVIGGPRGIGKATLAYRFARFVLAGGGAGELLTDPDSLAIAADHPVSFRWISDAEMEASPRLIRTMSVKPPMGTGRVRLVAIGADGAVDLQPCGGTHVRSTGEIGRISVAGIESKGKQNRRINLAFAA